MGDGDVRSCDLKWGRGGGGPTEDVASALRLEDCEGENHVNHFKGRGKWWRRPRA